jgi:hypothetical protein
MDFTDKNDAKASDNFSEAFKLRMESMERRFKKDSNSTKSKKDFTKEELLQRKKELLKNARLNIQSTKTLDETP